MKDHHIWYCAMMAWFWSLKGQFSQPKIYGFLVLVFNIRDQIFLGDFNVMNEWHLQKVNAIANSFLARILVFAPMWAHFHVHVAALLWKSSWRYRKDVRWLKGAFGEHVRACGERLWWEHVCFLWLVAGACGCVGACGLLVAGPWSLVLTNLSKSSLLKNRAGKGTTCRAIE